MKCAARAQEYDRRRCDDRYDSEQDHQEAPLFERLDALVEERDERRLGVAHQRIEIDDADAERGGCAGPRLGARLLLERIERR
jgi:hypothetical protein